MLESVSYTHLSSIMLIRSGTEENLEKKKELWRYLRSADIHIYRKLYMSVLGLSLIHI